MSPKNYCAHFFLSRLDYCNSLLVGHPKYLLSKLQKVQNNVTTTRLIFKHPDLPTSHLMTYASCSSLATYWAENWIQVVCLSELFTFTLPPDSSLFCRHPSVLNTILPNKVQWSALSLTRLQLFGTSSLFCPSFYLHHFVQIFLENLSLLKSHFFSPIVLTLCVYVCVCWRCMHWILKICAFKERVSIYSLCRLGTLSIHYYYYTLWSVTTTNYYRFRSELWFLYLFCKSCIPAEKCHTTVSVFDQQTCERQDLDAEASSPVLTSSTHNYSAKQTNAKCTG